VSVGGLNVAVSSAGSPLTVSVTGRGEPELWVGVTVIGTFSVEHGGTLIACGALTL